jgi:hypothetical protein
VGSICDACAGSAQGRAELDSNVVEVGNRRRRPLAGKRIDCFDDCVVAAMDTEITSDHLTRDMSKSSILESHPFI